MTARPEPNHLVMLNLFQHLICFFLPLADAPFIPVHRTEFLAVLLVMIERFADEETPLDMRLQRILESL